MLQDLDGQTLLGRDPYKNMVERNSFPGSIGLSPALFDLEKELLRHGLTTIKVCPCQEGCPSCV